MSFTESRCSDFILSLIHVPTHISWGLHTETRTVADLFFLIFKLALGSFIYAINAVILLYFWLNPIYFHEPTAQACEYRLSITEISIAI